MCPIKLVLPRVYLVFLVKIQRRELRNKRVYTSSIRKASHDQPGNIHLLINLYLRNLVLFRVSLDDTLAIELPQF